MLRSLLVEALPVAATAAAMLYTQPRKGWKWAVPAGIVAHLAAGWAMRKVANALEGVVSLPAQSVTMNEGKVEVPPLEDPAKFHGIPPVPEVVPAPTPKPVEVIDQHDNVIKLPVAMGEP